MALAQVLRDVALPRRAGRQKLDGQRLHKEIARDQWCLTKEDLVRFRKAVEKSIALGIIQPTERDDFDPKCSKIGPNIYTVTEQFIKPASSLYGDASWALMCNPEGIPCDLFVTHAWAEGVFELVDKVLRNWPWEAKSVYICVLSNPQNLDITSLIANPAESPFAEALAKANTMLVVPNHVCSLYSRLWCVYEAYLAVEKGLMIEIAKKPTRASKWAVVPCFFMAALGIFLGCAYSRLHGEEHPHVFMYMAATPLCLSLLLLEDLPCRLCNYAGCITIGFYTFFGYEHQRREAKGITSWHFWKTYLIFWFIYCTYYVMAELDRIARVAVHKSSVQLRKGYHGSVHFAECSSNNDYESIWRAIGDQAKEVDFSIHVLRCAGMSTPNLREADRMGVHVLHAGLEEHAYLVVKYTITLYYFCQVWRHFGGGKPPRWPSVLPQFLAVMVFLVQLVWTAMYLTLPKDRRAFHLKTASKVFSYGFPALLFLRCYINEPAVPLKHYGLAVSSGSLICLGLLTSICISGLGVVRIAGISPPLARFLVSRWGEKDLPRINEISFTSQDGDSSSDESNSSHEGTGSSSEEALALGSPHRRLP